MANHSVESKLDAAPNPVFTTAIAAKCTSKEDICSQTSMALHLFATVVGLLSRSLLEWERDTSPRIWGITMGLLPHERKGQIGPKICIELSTSNHSQFPLWYVLSYPMRTSGS